MEQFVRMGDDVSNAMSMAVERVAVGHDDADLLVEVQPGDLPPADLSARALSSLCEPQEWGGVDMVNFSNPTFGMIQLYSPARQWSLFCFNQNAAWPYNSLLDDTTQAAGGAPFFAAAPDSFASPLQGAASDPYSLPPLPPSLGYGPQAHWPDHDSNLLQHVLPGEAMSWFSQAVGPEILFGPGAQNIPSAGGLGQEVQLQGIDAGLWCTPVQSDRKSVV